MRPCTFRPACFESGASSVFSGSDFVISWKSDTVMKRRPGEVGLNLRTAISPSHSRSERFDGLAGCDRHDGLLPARAAAARHPAALGLRRHLGDVHGDDVDLEDALHRLADLRLVSVGVHAERVLAALADHAVALLGHDRCDEDCAGIVSHSELPSSTASAALVTTSERAQTTSATSSVPTGTTWVRCRFRNDRSSASSPSAVTTTSGVLRPCPATSSAAFFVFGSSNVAASATTSVPSVACAESAIESALPRAFLLILPV